MGSLVRSGIADRSVCPTCNSDQIEEAGALSLILANMERELGIDSEDYEDFTTYPNPIHRLGAAIAQIEQEFGVKEEDFYAESFEAQEKKALWDPLPVPMIWIDGGGQLPYTHVVVDVSGSMATPTFTPNWSGEGQFSRAEYVMFLLLEMYLKRAIKADTRIYPHTSQSLGAFISAGFVVSPDVGPEVWPLLFAPHAGSTKLNHMSKLPHTKTLLITDVGEQSLPRLVGGTWVVSPEYKKFQKSLKKGWIGETPKFSGVRGNIENAPFDIISW